MQYLNYYHTSLGEMTMVSDGKHLTGLFFTDVHHALEGEVKELPVFELTRQWLEQYFTGNLPMVQVPIKLEGSEFQKLVWHLLLKIPYGKLATYGSIAKEIAKQRGLKRMSAQAVGGAVGRNPICLLVPCHRVIGADGSMIGYGEGIERKIELLKLEKSYLY